ncbi:hypothetical protein YC2023_017756 [Brassica napus]
MKKKKDSAVKKRDAAAKKKKYVVKKKRDSAKKSDVVVKKRKLDNGVHDGSSSNPTKQARNRKRETTSPSDLQGGFSDLEDVWDDLPVSRLKYNALDDFQEVFQTTSMKSSKRVVWKTSWKSSDGVFSHVSLFHNISERFGFSDLEDFLDDLLVSRLKYNALDDFQEVFQTTSWKSSRLLQGILPDNFQEVVWISWKSSGEVFFHIKWSPSLSL